MTLKQHILYAACMNLKTQVFNVLKLGLVPGFDCIDLASSLEAGPVEANAALHVDPLYLKKDCAFERI